MGRAVHIGACDTLKSAFISMGYPVLQPAYERGVKGKNLALWCGSRCRILQHTADIYYLGGKPGFSGSRGHFKSLCYKNPVETVGKSVSHCKL